MDDAENYIRRQRYPKNIDGERDTREKEIYHKSDKNTERTKDSSQNTADDRIVAVKRLEEMPEHHAKGEGSVEMLQCSDKRVANHPRTVNIPMVKKIENPIKETLQQISQRKIHNKSIAEIANRD
jgi:hypothetical protein